MAITVKTVLFRFYYLNTYMDYFKIYASLMAKGKERTLDCYTEGHHIIPKCMGGLDSKENIVDLTPEEHFVAHLLLVKMYPKNGRLIYAANMMGNRCNKKYGWLRRLHAIQQSKDHKGWSPTIEQRKHLSEIRKGVPKSEKHKKNIGTSNRKPVEYYGTMYPSWSVFIEETGVSKFNYDKYYLNGVDPTPFINNRAYGMIKHMKEERPKWILGKKLYNNGSKQSYFTPGMQPDGWEIGRIACKV